MPLGCTVWMGLPFESKPLIQFTFTNGLPSMNFPVSRFST